MTKPPDKPPKDHPPKPDPPAAPHGHADTPTISARYRDEQMWLHAEPRGYGGRGSKWSECVAWLRQGYGCASVLDYGCGQGSLAAALSLRGIGCAEYDPAIPGKDGPPAPADLVVCTDVLEHVEPDRLPAVLAELERLTRRILFLVINLEPSNKELSDGRNAHLLIREPAWWLRRLLDAGDWQERQLVDLPVPPRLNRPPKSAKYRLVVLEQPERRTC